MIREPGRRAILAVRTVKAAATTAVAVAALALTLGGATAGSGESPEPAGSTASDTRCVGAAGKTIVRTRGGEAKAVSFERGWRVYRGQRPGTLVVVCPD